MRAFGFIAAFAAFTSVFAAPIAAPASNAVEARGIPHVNVATNTGTVPVNANVAGIVVDLKVNVDQFTSNVNSVLANTEDTVENIISELLPPLQKLVQDILSAAGKIALAQVGSLFNFGQSTSNMTLGQLGEMISTIEKDLVDVLCKIANIIGQEHPEAAAVIQSIIGVLNMLTQAITEITGDLNLVPLSSLIGPLLSGLGIHIPGVSKA